MSATTNATLPLQVLIVGASPTGLTLACELARRGVSFRLIEAAPGPRPGSRGKGVQPRTLEIFFRRRLVNLYFAGSHLTRDSGLR